MSTQRKNPFILLVACLSALLLPTSITGTAVTLPAIINDIGGDVVHLQWVVHAYDLTFASFMLAMGSLSDVYGRRRIFRLGMGTYAACALVTSLAQSLPLVDIVRGLTGVGAAAVMTSTAAALAQSYQGPAQARAFGLYGTSFGIGLAFGPMLGGGMVTALGWRSFFLVQVGIALLALAFSGAMPGRTPGQRARVDWTGAAYFVGCLFAFILGLVEIPQMGLSSPFVLGCFGASLALGAAFTVTEIRSKQPMFDLSLLRQRRYFAVCLAPVSLAFGFVALLVYLPIYFMTAHDMSAWTAGLFMMALTLPTLYMPAIAGALVARGVSSRSLMVLCMTLVTLGCFWLITIGADASLLHTGLPLFVIGTGFGISNGILDRAAATSVEPARAGMAVGMFNTTRIAGEVIAIAVVGSLIVGYLRSYLEHNPLSDAAGTPAPQAVANGIAEGRYAELVNGLSGTLQQEFSMWTLQGFDYAMHWTYFWVGLLCALTIPVIATFMTPSKTPDTGAPEDSGTPRDTARPEPAID